MRPRFRHLLAFFIVFGLLSPVWAAQHCLWKVPGQKNNVYLIGSIHYFKKEYYPLPAPMEAALQTAQTVAFETDIAELSNPKNQMKMLSLGLCPPDKTIRDFLSKETYAALREQLGPAASAFDRFQPWFAAVTLIVLDLQKLGFDPSQGVDQYLHRQATQAGKKTVGLESVEFQMELFKTLSDQDQEQFLKESLAQSAKMSEMLSELISAWKAGDVKALEEFLLSSMRDYPKVEEKFLTGRNRDWLPKIEAYLKESEDVLVVVGAGHLIGGGSVVDLLKKKGYTVEQQ